MRRLWPAVLILIGCGEGDPGKGGGGNTDPCKASDDLELEVGTGATEFVELSSGGELELIHGPQGGYHVEIGLRAAHLDNSEFLAGRLEGWLGGEMLANTLPWFYFRCTDDGQDSWGTLLIYQATPEELHMQETRVYAEITDVAGNTIEAEGTFVIVDPELL